MNFFKATQEAYTTSKIRLPEWPEGIFLAWGTIDIRTESTDENGVVVVNTEKHTGLIKVTPDLGYEAYSPSEAEEKSNEWVRLE